MFGRAAQAQPGRGGQPLRLSAAEAGAAGRFGDSIIAHLTPGEITIPIQLQSPAVLKAIRAEFAKVGVNPGQFVAGSPQGSRNPQTGAQEFAFLGGLLPTLMSVGGGIAGGIYGGPGGAAAGAAAGGAAGTAIDGGSPTQDLEVGAASGLGSLAAPAVGSKIGSLVGSAAANTAGSAAASTAGTTAADSAVSSGLNAGTMAPSAALGNSVSGAATNAASSGVTPIAGSAAQTATATALQNQSSGLLGQLLSSRTMGAGMGSMYGQSLAGPIGKQPSNLPPGFNNNMAPVNPNFNQALGNQNASTPSFGGYNPTNMVQQGGGFNFYSPNGNGTP
jgi:hypothetical protein